MESFTAAGLKLTTAFLDGEPTDTPTSPSCRLRHAMPSHVRPTPAPTNSSPTPREKCSRPLAIASPVLVPSLWVLPPARPASSATKARLVGMKRDPDMDPCALQPPAVNCDKVADASAKPAAQSAETWGVMTAAPVLTVSA